MEKLTLQQQARVAVMRKLAAGQIPQGRVNFVGVFEDDHILGVVFYVLNNTGGRTYLAWPWCGWEVAGAVCYTDSPKAWAEVKEYAESQVKRPDGDEQPTDEEIAEYTDPSTWTKEE